MDTNLLKAYMVLNNDTYKSLANKLDISAQQLSKKINKKNNVEFTYLEILAIAKLYKLGKFEIDSIFFKNQ